LFVFLGLAASFAALGRRITTLAEEFLIFGRKREGLPAVTADELLIFSHISLSSMLQVCAAFGV
jgi:TRAP-type C4-dicarboxylate transport system permease large subunit